MHIFGWFLVVVIFLYFVIPAFRVKNLNGKGLVWGLENDQTAEVEVVGSEVGIKASSKKPFTIITNTTRDEASRFNSDTYMLDATLPPGSWWLSEGDNVSIENSPLTYAKITIRNGRINKAASIGLGIVFAGLASVPLWLF